MNLKCFLFITWIGCVVRSGQAEFPNYLSWMRSPSPLNVYSKIFQSFSPRNTKKSLSEAGANWGKRGGYWSFYNRSDPLRGWGNDILMGKRSENSPSLENDVTNLAEDGVEHVSEYSGPGNQDFSTFLTGKWWDRADRFVKRGGKSTEVRTSGRMNADRINAECMRLMMVGEALCRQLGQVGNNVGGASEFCNSGLYKVCNPQEKKKNGIGQSPNKFSKIFVRI
ncbi:uncharacterized protein LOC111707942 isoform X2 [Eurytemora carolleeae]|uniref:uncharacterized protein LOC111707942 isoform X2 n=1 Tax=Eurytemora carolleeae TaxID=1294199 RepID=UPI000C781472|nr:uncharacterized protein LOC111707942 isoform X2 [Eurytemora carolleeae]|eukprot:XP_023336902.1 uncharacterized protein LOC111707942 isoform X2 [Eurytemora affinis]